MQSYLDGLVNRYCAREREICILLTLTTDNDCRLAERVLALRRIYPGLELAAVVTRQQMRSCQHPNACNTAFARRMVLHAADRVEIVSNARDFMYFVELHRYFLNNCDLILFRAFGTGAVVVANFRAQLRDMAEPPVVRYLESEMPIRPLENIESVLTLAGSIDYIRSHDFHVTSDCLPPELLARWLKSDAAPGCYSHLSALEDIAAIFRVKDSEGRDYLLLKVFTYAYALHHNLWAVLSRSEDAGAMAGFRFRQFRRMLELVSEARAKGLEVGGFDLLDFDNYDETLRRMGWLGRLDEQNARLCDQE